MSERMLRVAIIGGGLAGPCLAHALLRSGAQVLLYERNPGFAIQVAPEGTHALRSCLPPHLYQLAVATSGKRGSAEAVLSSQLEVLLRMTFEVPVDDDGSAGISVDRLTFRRVLLAGLEATVRFGASFTH